MTLADINLIIIGFTFLSLVVDFIEVIIRIKVFKLFVGVIVIIEVLIPIIV